MKQFTLDKTNPDSWPFVSTIASALVERRNAQGETELLIQKRLNCNDSVYYGTWEIPAGHIDKFENVYDTVRREVKEETGLDVVEFIDDKQTAVASNGDDGVFAFKPFICNQYLKGKGWSWIGFVFRCRVAGDIVPQAGETDGHQWVTIEVLKKMLQENPKQFFTLQVPVLEYYIQCHEKENTSEK